MLGRLWLYVVNANTDRNPLVFGRIVSRLTYFAVGEGGGVARGGAVA
jgi:hypothetical protein